MTEESNLPDQRQTLSYIKGLLRERRLIPKNKMGQNFLIDLNLLDVVVRAGELDSSDCVLEVGTGTGGLTSRMADHAGAVFSMELDSDLHQLASRSLYVKKNVVLAFGDALDGKNSLNPTLTEGWEETRVKFNCTRRKLVANLPYAIATPLIANLMISELPIERFVVMIQYEVAERMMSTPGTKNYGSLAIMVQSIAKVEIVRQIAPSNFWPPPKVDSAIVKITPHTERNPDVPPLSVLRPFLRDLYSNRRKNLRQALSGWPQGRRDKKWVDGLLAQINIDGSKRAETLDLQTHWLLCKTFTENQPPEE